MLAKEAVKYTLEYQHFFLFKYMTARKGSKSVFPSIAHIQGCVEGFLLNTL